MRRLFMLFVFCAFCLITFAQKFEYYGTSYKTDAETIEKIQSEILSMFNVSHKSLATFQCCYVKDDNNELTARFCFAEQGRDMYGLMRLTGKEYYKFEYHELGGKNVVYFYRGKDKLRDPWGVNFTTTTCWTSKTMESFIDFIRKSAIEEINAEAKEKTNLGAVLAGHAFCIEIDKSSMTGLGQMIFRGVKTYEYVEFTATKYIVAIISLPEGERLTVQSLRTILC